MQNLQKRADKHAWHRSLVERNERRLRAATERATALALVKSKSTLTNSLLATRDSEDTEADGGAREAKDAMKKADSKEQARAHTQSRIWSSVSLLKSKREVREQGTRAEERGALAEPRAGAGGDAEASDSESEEERQRMAEQEEELDVFEQASALESSKAASTLSDRLL
jgi:hypothetical protein